MLPEKVSEEAAKKKSKKNKKKKKKQAQKLLDSTSVYQVQQNNPVDMEALMVVAEEEYIEPSKTQAVAGIMKVRTAAKDYMRID